MTLQDFKSLQWGYGPGLAECQVCLALVLPDAAEAHIRWHEAQK